MANTNAPFGFRPYGPVLHAEWYPIPTSNATAFYIGDWVEIQNTGLVCKVFGGDTRLGIEIDLTGAAGDELGAVIALMDHNGDPIKYLPTTQTGDGVVAGYALIADSPFQQFIVQEDGDTTPIAAASLGLNCVVTAGSGGSTKTGLSSHMLDSNTVANTNTFAVRIVQSYKDDTVGSAYCRFIVVPNPNAHFFSSATAI